MGAWHRRAILNQLHGDASPATAGKSTQSQIQARTARPTSSPSLHPSLVDHARNILESNGALTDEVRATLWDAYHDSRTASAFARKLAEVDAEIPPDTQEALLAAKKRSQDGLSRAIDLIASLDARGILDVAEAHPNVLKFFIDAALKG